MLWLALDVWDVLLPCRLHLFKYWWWHGELRGASIDECWVPLVWDVRGIFSVVEQALSEECPWLEIGHVILKDFETIVAIHDLRWVVAAEKRVWLLFHVVLRDTETDHSSVDLATFTKCPEEVLLLKSFVLFGAEAEDTVELVGEAFCFVKGQELERWAFALLQFLLHKSGRFQLLFGHIWGVHRLDASIILENEAIELSRSIIDFLCSVWGNFGRWWLINIKTLIQAPTRRILRVNQTIVGWVVLFELESSWRGCIGAQRARYRQELWSSVEGHLNWLTRRRAEMNRSEVERISQRLENNFLLLLIFNVKLDLGLLSDQLACIWRSLQSC